MTRWYRAYEGTVSDPKLAEAAMLARVPRAVSIAAWHAVLESAAGANDGGRFPTSPHRVAAALSEPDGPIAALFAAFSELGLIASGAIEDWESIVGRDRPFAHEWAVIRARIFERDDYTCTYCGARGVRLECDHIVPVARGGGHEDDNLTTACQPCNRAKRDKLISEWRP